MSIATLSQQAIDIAHALRELEDLPCEALYVYGDSASLGLPSNYFSDRTAMTELCSWANAFNVVIIISLSRSGGDGVAETTVVLGGHPVSIKCRVTTAGAYDLGRILQRELNRDVSIHIGAEELLAAIDQVVAK